MRWESERGRGPYGHREDIYIYILKVEKEGKLGEMGFEGRGKGGALLLGSRG